MDTTPYISEYVCIYKYMHAIRMNGKRGCEFEGEEGGICGRVWREEREGRNVLNYINKNN